MKKADRVLNITRRDAMKCAIAGALAPCVLNVFDPSAPPESEIVDLDAYTPPGDSDAWTPAAVAKFLSAWELSSQQENRPNKWRRLRYDNAIQWRDCRYGHTPLICFFGIGPAEWTEQRMADLLDWLGVDCGLEQNILAAERIACGRAFGIIFEGQLSSGLQYVLARPAWTEGKISTLIQRAEK